MNGSLRTHTRATQPRVRLVCFPHAGGSASFFRTWQTLVPPGLELVAVQYPGRQDRFDEPPADDMNDLVRGLLPDLERLGDLPAVFLGHSMGAAVAYEAIRRMSWKPELLVVSARPAPSLGPRGDLHLRSDAGLLAGLAKMGGFQLEALSDPEMRDLFMPILRADFHLIETYRPEQGVRIDVPVLAVVGDRDREVSVTDIQAWRDATTAGFAFEVLAGDHFYISRHAPALISTTLRRIDRDGVAT